MIATFSRVRRALPGAYLSLLAACSSQGPTLTCGSGTVQQGATCVAAMFCDPGAHLDGGACIADVTDAGPPVACGQGTVLDGATCIPANGTMTAASTFGPSVRVAAPGVSYSESPRIAVNSAGDIFIAGLQVTTSADVKEAVLWVSQDHGQSFTLLKERKATSVGIVQSTSLAIDPADRVAWSWTTQQNTAGGVLGSVFVSFSADGVSFPADTQINQSDAQDPDCEDAWLSIDRAGNVFLSWVYGSVSTSTYEFGVRFAENTDLGAGLGTPIDLAPVVSIPMSYRAIRPSGPLAFDSMGAVVTAVDDVSFDSTGYTSESISAIRREAGTSLTTYLMSPESGRYFTVQPAPVVVSDSRGGLTAAFVDGTSRQLEIYVSHSANGVIWAPPAPLDEGTIASGAALPWLAVDERDRVHALWLDNRSGAWLPYTALSRDGRRFEASEPVGDQSFVEDGTATRSIGNHLSLVVRGGQRYAAWTDTREGHSQIRFATSPEPE